MRPRLINNANKLLIFFLYVCTIFQRYPPLRFCTARCEHEYSLYFSEGNKRKKKTIPGGIMGQHRPEKITIPGGILSQHRPEKKTQRHASFEAAIFQVLHRYRSAKPTTASSNLNGARSKKTPNHPRVAAAFTAVPTQ